MYEVTITWADGSENSENFEDLIKGFGWTLSMLGSSGNPPVAEINILVVG